MASFFRWNRHIKLLADFAHEMGVNLTMAGHRAAETLGRVQYPGVVAPFAHNNATVSLEMAEQLFSLQGKAPTSVRTRRRIGSTTSALLSLTRGFGRGR